MLSNQLDSTRIERLVTVDVDLSYRKSICKTTLLMTSRVDPCDSSRFVYTEYPNLTLKYVLSSFAIRLPVRRIYFTNNESCPPVRIVSIRQHLMPLLNALGRKKIHLNIYDILIMEIRPFHAFRTWKVHDRQIMVLFAKSELWLSLCADWLRGIFYCYLLTFGKLTRWQ